jgi:hypothetical protein
MADDKDAPAGDNAETLLDTVAEPEAPADPKATAVEHKPTTATPATDAAKPAEKPEWLQDKFWDAKTGQPTFDKLAKSYGELEKQFKAGAHKAPKDGKYDLSPVKDVPADDPMLSVFLEIAKENGLSQKAVTEILSVVGAQTAAQREAMTVNVKAEMEKLGANAKEILTDTLRWSQSLVAKGVLTRDEQAELKIMAGTATGVKVLQKMRAYYGDRAIPVNVGAVDGESYSKDDLQAMVGKPEYKTDPAYRRKVEKLFEQHFPGTYDPNRRSA